jgi:flagellar secretion chaperone FliS
MEPTQMTPYMSASNQYINTQVTTASPEQILIQLYGGAIRFVLQAQQALAAGERVRKLEGISRAMAIISELSNTLDHEIGGAIAENLDALYHFMIRELTQANLDNDAKKLKVVEELLTDLRETWIEAIEIARKEKQQADAPPENDYRPLSGAL